MLDSLDRWERLEKRIARALGQGLEQQPEWSRHTEALLDFIPRITPRFSSPTHLASLTALFERAVREPVRAVVSTPPRHGKTETLIHGIAWALADDPSRQISYISYAHRFAEKKSRKARELTQRAEVRLAADAQSRADWRTGVEDGGVWATSIGGAVTGEGFHLMLVDDPVKDRAKAESQAFRDDCYEWFTDTAYTRLEPSGSCIVNMARWHEDDLAGRLLSSDMGWEDIRLPAIDDDGRALWPERWSVERLRQIEKQVGAYGWNSLYLGNPRPRESEGALWSRKMLDDARVPKAPEDLVRAVVAIDPAVTATETSDETGIVVAGMASDGHVYILADVSGRMTPLEWAKKACKAYNDFRCDRIVAEENNGGELVEANLATVVKNAPYTGVHASRGKRTRAEPIAALYEQGLVHHVGRFAELESQMCTWEPLSGFRSPDRLDALVWAVTNLKFSPTQRRGLSLLGERFSATGG